METGAHRQLKGAKRSEETSSILIFLGILVLAREKTTFLVLTVTKRPRGNFRVPLSQ